MDRREITGGQGIVIIPQDIVDKIQYLCKRFASQEWSGILFYNVEDTNIDPKDFKCIVKDIFLMDVGSATHTEFDYDGEFIKAIEHNPDLEKCRKGLIHSHSCMNVFFSGTDDKELYDNADNHSYYLSLIVNNNLDACAKICYITKEKITRCFKFFKGKNIEEERECAISVDMYVQIEKIKIEIEKFFLDRVDEVIKKKEESKYIYNNQLSFGFNNSNYVNDIEDDDAIDNYYNDTQDNRNARPRRIVAANKNNKESVYKEINKLVKNAIFLGSKTEKEITTFLDSIFLLGGKERSQYYDSINDFLFDIYNIDCVSNMSEEEINMYIDMFIEIEETKRNKKYSVFFDGLRTYINLFRHEKD